MRTLADQCRAYYVRTAAEGHENVRCTYVSGHQARHSWETLQAQDDQDARREAATVREALRSADLPQAVRLVVEGLTAGRLDPYIEVILAAGHDRKRARRGVAGFPRRTA